MHRQKKRPKPGLIGAPTGLARSLLLIVVPALAVASIWIASPAAGAAELCQPEPGNTRAVVKVIDGETLALDDGSEVRLIGALSPRLLDSGGDDSFWPPEREARAALEHLTLGKSVELGFSGRRTDRYGRLLAHVYVTGGQAPLWVQEHMLRVGRARAYSLPGNTGCIEQLIEHERTARRSGAGLWSNPAYQIRSAQRTRELLRLRNTFQLVEGRVFQVSESKGQIFINFGRDWREDFTIRTRTSDWKQYPINWKSLEGQRVLARGWIDRRSGPSIDLLHPSHLEILGD